MIENEPYTTDFVTAQRLAAIVESSDDAIIGKNLNGIIQSWNRGAERIFGYTAEEAIGKPITIVIPSDLHDQEAMILERVAKGERIERLETIRCRKDGTQIYVSLTVSPIRDPSGKIVGASKIGRDISDLKKSHERQGLLLREMSHRVKNLFAIASGVVALSARANGLPKNFTIDVQSRLAALARAHELILPAGRMIAGTTTLADLIRTIVDPYEDKERRILVDGPQVVCGPNTSSAFALLFHEFATNSVKYGALSQVGAGIEVSWIIEEALKITWREQIFRQSEAEEGAAGFGSFLVGATTKSLGARFEKYWQDDQLIMRLELALPRLVL